MISVSSRTGNRADRARANASQTGDGELVRRTLAGRRDGFDVLVGRYQRRATSVAYRLVGNLHDALEVCQDAFVRAYRRLPQLEEPRRFGPWLLRIVTNLALNYRRDRAVGGRKLSLADCIRDEDGSQPASRATDAPPDAAAQAAELAAIIRQAIAALPERQRLALILFSIEQVPQKEVARLLDCSVEAVKWHVFQARRKLRHRLADYL